MAEVKLMRNGVYVSVFKVVTVVKDGEFLNAGHRGRFWAEDFPTCWCPAGAVGWTEDALVLPEEYLA